MFKNFIFRFFKCVKYFKNNCKYNVKSQQILDYPCGLYFENLKKIG